MANWCSISVNIQCETDEEAEHLTQVLSQVFKKAYEDNAGAYIGSTTRYFFGPNVSRNGNQILLSGEVRWALEQSEMSDWLHWLLKHAKISSMTAEYQEDGCLIFGFYQYDGQILSDRYLPTDFFPDYPENEDDDEYARQLNEALEKHGIECLLEEIAA